MLHHTVSRHRWVRRRLFNHNLQSCADLVNYDVAVPPLSSAAALETLVSDPDNNAASIFHSSTWLDRARKVENSRLQRFQGVLRVHYRRRRHEHPDAAAHPLEVPFWRYAAPQLLSFPVHCGLM